MAAAGRLGITSRAGFAAVACGPVQRARRLPSASQVVGRASSSSSYSSARLPAAPLPRLMGQAAAAAGKRAASRPGPSAPSAAAAGVETAASAVPSWDELAEMVGATPTGQRINKERAEQAAGGGPPHTDAKLRLFGKEEKDVRVTLYRDLAGWCPYCQKVWMMLEEKKIPYKLEKVAMRSYGDKPEWFLKKVPSGLLPVIDMDGEIIKESLVIMQILESNYPENPMLPRDEAGLELANKLLGLERQLFGAWCSLVFRPDSGGFLGGGGGSRKAFDAKMDELEKALALSQSRGSPWLLGGAEPSIVDLQYISHVERMNASALAWRGVNLRSNPKWPNLEKWFDAFEQRDTYQCTKSDYYTHYQDIPPQYGPGISDNSKEALACEAAVSGQGDAWRLPLSLGPSSLEPLSPHMDPGEEGARHEAAWKLVGNRENVARFAARGMGKPGKRSFQAPLADPYAEPAEDFIPDVDAALRATAFALLVGADAVPKEAFKAAGGVRPQNSISLVGADAVPKEAFKAAGGGRRDGVQYCLEYLRDRVGVPRDMGQAAAFNFRAHLNHALDNL